MRIQWNGGMRGFLNLSVHEGMDIHSAEALLGFLTENCFAEDSIHFESKDFESFAAAALFMAIREIAPTKRGNVLDIAVSILGGAKTSMNPGYSWMMFPQILHDLNIFGQAVDRLAGKLKPFQTESQYALKCLAYELLEERMGDAGA